MAKQKKFPVFWTIVLIFALTWFLRELGYFTLNIPWLPLILLIFAIGAIINHYNN